MRLPVSLLDALDVGKLLANYEYTKLTVEDFRDNLEKRRKKQLEYTARWLASLSPEQLEIVHQKKLSYQKAYYRSWNEDRREQNREYQRRRYSLLSGKKREKMLLYAREYRRAYIQREDRKEHLREYNRLRARRYRARKKAERLAMQGNETH